MRKLYSRIFLGLVAVLCSYASMAQISVTATAGTMGPTAYTTLKAAFDAINAGTHQGAITVSVTANTTETAKDSLVGSGVGSASYTSVLIKPAAGVTATIAGSAASTILLYGADNVTIDGSNTAGGTSRNLTITNSATNGVVIHVASASASNGATTNTIKNSIIKGGAGTIVGIITGSGTTLGGDAEAPNSNNTITNNAINTAQNAIYIRGNTTTVDANWSVTNNDLGSATAAEKLTFRGMLIGNVSNYTVSGNKIFGVVSSATSTATMTGIQVALNHNNGQIFNNRISDIKQSNPAGWGSNGISLAASSTASNVTIHNNFIWDVAAAGFDSVGILDNGYGIIATSGGGYNIYYNTVVLNTNQTAATGHPIAFNVTAGVTTAGSLNVRNNHFIVTSTVGTDRLAIYSGAPNTVFAAIDYNNYYSSGANLGFIGTLRSNLAAIQAGFGGNTNSLNINPAFVSATDLHMAATNTTLDNKGTPIAGITTDIDADVRSATTPDIGADEFTSSSTCTNPVINTQPTAQTACSGANAVFTVAASGTGLTYQWKLNGNNVTAGTGGTTATYTVPASAAVAGNYTVVVSSGTCSVTSNAVALTVNAATAITTHPASVTACQGTATFTVAATGTGTLTYQWRFGTTPIPTATSATLQVPVTQAAAGTYNVVVTGTCGTATSNNATLTVQNCTAVPTVNADITSVVMTPNVVRDVATVRVTATKAMKLTWNIVDAEGKVVMTVSSNVVPGKNTITLNVGKLSNGTYQLKGASTKGVTGLVRFVKM